MLYHIELYKLIGMVPPACNINYDEKCNHYRQILPLSILSLYNKYNFAY